MPRSDNSSRPNEPPRSERTRDHIKGAFEPGPVASGASVLGRDGVPAPSPSWARRDAIGIPVSILSSGPTEVERATGRRPLDEVLEARVHVPSPSTPITPAEQPARIDALAAAVRARTDLVPELGIVLGSGLGGLADEVEAAIAIPFAELPGWPAATAPGHVGRLILGRLGGRPVVMLQGRFHYYEGNAPGLVIQPVLLFKHLGARLVILTNASGGLDPSFGPGTLMVINDHINLTGLNPLIGPNADSLGERFPDVTNAWSPVLRVKLHAAGRAEGVELAEGVYLGLTGPNYETPAEV